MKQNHTMSIGVAETMKHQPSISMQVLSESTVEEVAAGEQWGFLRVPIQIPGVPSAQPFPGLPIIE